MQHAIFNIMKRKYDTFSFLTFSIDLQQIGTLQCLEKSKNFEHFKETVNI
jgi:hypothetical protein